MRARTTPDDALVEYLEDHGLRRIGRRLASSGALEVVATAVPGMKDILVLGKVKQLERAGAADLIVIDAPAAGHAVTFLLSAQGLLDAVRVGPIRKQAQDVVELLTDAERCQVMLVTVAEETPVNELVETAFAIEDRAGVALGPVVVNGCVAPIPDLTALAADRLDGDVRRRPRHLGGGGRVPPRPRAPTARPGRASGADAAAAHPSAVPLHRRHRSRRDRPPRRRAHRRRARSSRCAGVTSPAPRLAELLASRHVIVCCGTGGVGKTTTAAALAIEGAARTRHRGRHH